MHVCGRSRVSPGFLNLFCIWQQPLQQIQIVQREHVFIHIKQCLAQSFERRHDLLKPTESDAHVVCLPTVQVPSQEVECASALKYKDASNGLSKRSRTALSENVRSHTACKPNFAQSSAQPPNPTPSLGRASVHPSAFSSRLSVAKGNFD